MLCHGIWLFCGWRVILILISIRGAYFLSAVVWRRNVRRVACCLPGRPGPWLLFMAGYPPKKVPQLSYFAHTTWTFWPMLTTLWPSCFPLRSRGTPPPPRRGGTPNPRAKKPARVIGWRWRARWWSSRPSPRPTPSPRLLWCPSIASRLPIREWLAPKLPLFSSQIYLLTIIL